MPFLDDCYQGRREGGSSASVFSKQGFCLVDSSVLNFIKNYHKNKHNAHKAKT